jgi:hypothetical protein
VVEPSRKIPLPVHDSAVAVEFLTAAQGGGCCRAALVAVDPLVAAHIDGGGRLSHR